MRRRALDGGERDAVYTVKPSHAVHRRTTASDGGPTGMLLLRSRFQVVDHFTYESAAARAALPESGRSYLYTITPMDLAGNAGRPLTLIATRYPDEAPPVPLNGELTATYRLNANDLIPEGADVLPEPPAFPPSRVHIEWDDTPETQTNAHVAVRDYRLIFRKDPTLPVGSYGLDSTTQRPPARLLPTSNARPLASDIKITLQDIDSDPATGRRSADILARPDQAGRLPRRERPDLAPRILARVFFQTVSANGVPSSLVPVELRLRAESSAPAGQKPRASKSAPCGDGMAGPPHPLPHLAAGGSTRSSRRRPFPHAECSTISPSTAVLPTSDTASTRRKSAACASAGTRGRAMSLAIRST